MEKLFISIFNFSISAGYFILAVAAVRLLFKKIPKNIICVLWLLVGIRLVFPVSIESAVGLLPDIQVINENIMEQQDSMINSGITAVDRPLNHYLQSQTNAQKENAADLMVLITRIFARIWAVGMVLLLGYFLFSWLRIHRQVKTAVPLIVENTKVYVSDQVETPFLLGVISPRIYLPAGLPKEEAVYVLAHEKAHIKRRDYLIKPAAYLILMVYWFQPLVWLAYILLCRDIEQACDERVIRQLGVECKKEYSQSLLNCSVNRRVIAACPVAFGEVSVKQRIKNILNYKKPGFWVILAAVLVCIVVSVCFMTNRTSGEETPQVIAGADQTQKTDTAVEDTKNPEETSIFTVPQSITKEICSYEVLNYSEVAYVDSSGVVLGTMRVVPFDEAIRLEPGLFYLIGNYGYNPQLRQWLESGQTQHTYTENDDTTYIYEDNEENGVTGEKGGLQPIPNAKPGEYRAILLEEETKQSQAESGENTVEYLPNEKITTTTVPTGYCYLFILADESSWKPKEADALRAKQQQIVEHLDEVLVEELIPSAQSVIPDSIEEAEQPEVILLEENGKAVTAEAFAESWAQAFCRRNGKKILSMVSKDTEQWLRDQDLLMGEEYASFGWSSPWPMSEDMNSNYTILKADEQTAEILYYAWTSDPHMNVWRETLEYEKAESGYSVTWENLEYMSGIASAEEFFRAYPDGKITDTSMDYEKNEFGEILNKNAKENRDSKFYQPLFAPETAACSLLNIVDNNNKVELGVSTDGTMGIAQVTITFLEDGSFVGVTMVQPYGEDGIWIPKDNAATRGSISK